MYVLKLSIHVYHITVPSLKLELQLGGKSVCKFTPSPLQFSFLSVQRLNINIDATDGDIGKSCHFREPPLMESDQ